MSQEHLIVPQAYKLNRAFREKRNGHLAATLWFTGLSGSGKSSLANRVEQLLAEQGISTYVLDGDNIRGGLNRDLDFTDQGREENIRRIAEVAKLMNDAGLVVLTAFISPFKADRKQARTILSESLFTEVHVDCPLDICEARDVKGLYKKARRGEIAHFTGIDSPFEIPDKPEIKVSTHLTDLEGCAVQIRDYILPRLKAND